MIWLMLTMLYEQYLMPPHGRKLDRIDKICIWTIRLCLVVLFFSLPDAVNGGTAAASDNNEANTETTVDKDFFFACSGGKLDEIKTMLTDHPDWVNSRTENGESCLHLTGIYGHSSVTKFLLEEANADPNIRSTYSEGLRMHPLSWNVYGGHYDNIALLLENGADPNLDFDSMGPKPIPTTSLDVALQLIVNEHDHEDSDQKVEKIVELMRKYGAKTMAELNDEEEL